MSPAAATARSRQVPTQRPPARPARPTLRLLPAGRGRRRRSLGIVIALAILVSSLLAVVGGHLVLTQGQVHLSVLQARVASEQALHRREVLALAQAESPQRVVQRAESAGHLVPATGMQQLPYVPLNQPLPAVQPSTPPASPPSGG